MVSLGGNTPVMAIIEYASHSECRMRSMNVFNVGDRLEFPLAVHGTPTIALSGTVVNRKQIGPRYSYAIALLPAPTQTEAIVKATQTAHGRPPAPTPDVHTGNGLTRTSVRVPIDAEVGYTYSGSTARAAHATNISTGGVLMKTTDELPVGASLELHIPLNAERVSVHGRIVAHQRESDSYNIAFYHMTNEAHDIIARFVDSKTEKPPI
ncbi:MAG: PilZ domain-containing protein [Candidatus Aquilonibacter sp.]